VITYFWLIIGICVFSRETLRLVFGAAYSARNEDGVRLGLSYLSSC